jgi:exonuclease SbcC
LTQAQRDLSNATEAQRAADASLSELRAKAGVQDVSMLPAIGETSLRRHRLRERLAEIEEQVVQQTARALAQIAAEVAGQDLDSVGRRIEELEDEIAEQDKAVEAAQHELSRAKEAFEAIDGGASAAETRQAIEDLTARIAVHARAYARARFAGEVLGRVVQAYRKRHQGPLLKCASEIFSQVTQDSFTELVTDYADDRQVIRGFGKRGRRSWNTAAEA